MKDCLDEGRLQAFFDGELAAELMEQSARHLTVCEICLAAAREVEAENSIWREALDHEMFAGVPTERLRSRITNAIAGSASPAIAAAPERRRLPGSIAGLFRFPPQPAAVFATILAILIGGSIFAVVKLKRDRPEAIVAEKAPGPKIQPPATTTVSIGNSSERTRTKSPGATKPSVPQREIAERNHAARIKLIPGEENYLRTIATLDVGMKQNAAQTMTPINRAEYERNLKLVDYAIAATRSKAKRAPHDPDAAEFMFAAYQSKIDLLNSFSDQARLGQR